MNQIATFADGALSVSAGGYAASITVKSIESTWNALSHYPDRRTTIELQGLGARLNAVAAYASELGAKVEAFDVAGEVERFARRHVEVTRAYWAAESRCLSWFVVGPAKFPTRTNQKRQASRDNRWAEVMQHMAAAKKAMKRAAYPYGAPGEAIRSNDPDAVEKVRLEIAKAEALQAKMVAANKALRKGDGAALQALGFGATAITKLKQPDFCGCTGFPGYALSNNSANIRRMKARLADLQRMQSAGTVEKQHNTTAGAVEVVENAEAARIQIVFPGKPEASVRAVLKANGFRWAPSHGAWQRHLNEAGRWAAQRVLSALQTEGAAA